MITPTITKDKLTQNKTEFSRILLFCLQLNYVVILSWHLAAERTPSHD